MLALKQNSENLQNRPTIEQSAAALGKAFWRAVHLFQFNREEQAALLGLSSGNRSALKAYADKETVPEREEVFLRVGMLMGIVKNLRIIFPHAENRDMVYNWMKIEREEFNNKSAIDYIKENPHESFTRLFAVRRFLDIIRC
ncbi:MAG: hypothetical protein V4591_00300 [Bdellovibrionota bacterium]